MKKLIIFILALFSMNIFGQVVQNGNDFDSLNHASSKPSSQTETNKYFKAGVIPYQFLSRSSGIYLGVDFNRFSLEYRATYTIPTQIGTYWWGDRFYYQGVNNVLLVLATLNKNWKAGILFGYKYWWYEHQAIPNSYHSAIQVKSSYISGPCFGFEFAGNLSRGNFDCTFFNNFSVSYFQGTSITFETQGYNWSPSRGSVTMIAFNIALGFKFGFRKQLK